MIEHWSEKKTVVVHCVPDSKECKGDFKAATITGVPNNASVGGSGSETARSAFDYLNGLRTLGFADGVAVKMSRISVR